MPISWSAGELSTTKSTFSVSTASKMVGSARPGRKQRCVRENENPLRATELFEQHHQLHITSGRRSPTRQPYRSAGLAASAKANNARSENRLPMPAAWENISQGNVARSQREFGCTTVQFLRNTPLKAGRLPFDFLAVRSHDFDARGKNTISTWHNSRRWIEHCRVEACGMHGTRSALEDVRICYITL